MLEINTPRSSESINKVACVLFVQCFVVWRVSKITIKRHKLSSCYVKKGYICFKVILRGLQRVWQGIRCIISPAALFEHIIYYTSQITVYIFSTLLEHIIYCISPLTYCISSTLLEHKNLLHLSYNFLYFVHVLLALNQ